MTITQTDIDSLLSAAGGLADQPDLTAAPEPVASSGNTAPSPQASVHPPSPIAKNVPRELRRILKMHVPVIVELAEQAMSVSAILKLNSGSILEFERSADAELELLVNNKVIGFGQAVKVGENFGLRITRLCEVREAIKALGT
ncbi:MAG: FliM/FliN family flagellar motor switch protein [Phycisphaerae bacterium]|nr:FliM/FliN family flagellar motor switch protein [Phycisphaerae bacterium]